MGEIMADKNKKFSDNLFGKFYVDTDCIACDACVGIAPEFFAMNDDEAHAYVFRQPEETFEKESCEEALAVCPVDAIGNDGNS